MKNKELVRDMKVQESLGYSDCERMEVRILRGGNGEKVGLNHCISQKQTSSEVCLEEYHVL